MKRQSEQIPSRAEQAVLRGVQMVMGAHRASQATELIALRRERDELLAEVDRQAAPVRTYTGRNGGVEVRP